MADAPLEPRLPRSLELTSDARSRYYAQLDAQDETPPTPADALEAQRKQQIVKKGIKCYQVSVSAFSEQRKREIEDLKFDRALPEDQWPAEIRAERKGGIQPDGTVTPERPCLTIPKLDQPVQQVINEARKARLAINIKPRGGGATSEVARVRQGIIRSIEVDSQAQLARLWALDRAAKCGFGAYRINKKYTNDEDYDLDLTVEAILNQHSAHFDPFALKFDFSDGEFGLITYDYSEDYCLNRWGTKFTISNASAEQLQSIGDSAPGWVNAAADGTKTYRIAEFFYVTHEKRTRLHLTGHGDVYQDQIKEGAPPYDHLIENEREVDIRTVHWCWISAQDVLEEAIWEGSRIPMIPALGKEYNVEGKRCWKGIVSNAKDAQRSYNYMRSEQVTIIGLASRAPWIMAEGQDEGYEKMWDQSNTKYYTRLIYQPKTFEGELLPAPSRNVAEPAIQAVTIAVNEADNDIKATTGRYDPSLGRQRSQQSGIAIHELKQQGESTTSNYLEQLATVSMTLEGNILNEMLKFTYDRPGRIVRILGDEDEEQAVMLNAPFVPGPDGQPQAYQPPGAMSQVAGKIGQAAGRLVGRPGKPEVKPETYDLTKGEFSVVVEIGRSFATAREEDLATISDILQAAPQLIAPVADLFVGLHDSPIAQKMAERLKRMNPAAKGDDEQGGGEPPTPEQQQLLQQHEQLTQALQAALAHIKDLEAKAQLQIELKTMDVQSKDRIARQAALVNLEVAESKVDSTNAIALMRADIEQLRQELDQQHESRMAERDRQHERQMGAANATRDVLQQHADQTHERRIAAANAARDAIALDSTQRHDRLTAATQQTHDQQAAEQQQQHELELASRAAAAKPPAPDTTAE